MAHHEHKHPNDKESVSEDGSVDSIAYPGAALYRFEPGAQTFPQLKGQGRNKQFKEKWLKDLTEMGAMQQFNAYSSFTDQHLETTRTELRQNRWEPGFVTHESHTSACVSFTGTRHFTCRHLRFSISSVGPSIDTRTDTQDFENLKCRHARTQISRIDTRTRTSANLTCRLACHTVVTSALDKSD
jgi:hypothetical protein